MKYRNYNPVQPKSQITITKKTEEKRQQLIDDVVNFIADGGVIDTYSSTGKYLGSHVNV